jgi:hypothetical protein
VSERAQTLERIDHALAEVSAIESALRASRGGQPSTLDRSDLSRRFRAIAHAVPGHYAFAPVGELAGLAEKVTERADRNVLLSEQGIELVQHAADVLSLLLRDMGHQVLGRRAANVAPAAGALRERLEHMLLTDR